MRKNEVKKTFNMTVRFVFSFFTTLILTFLISGSLAFLANALGIISFEHVHPLLMLGLMLLSSTILGTVMSFFISKRSFRLINSILSVISEIGKGNFDVEIETKKTSDLISEIIRNINLMAKELKNLEIMRKDFIQNFSHEFKTPIVSIQGFAKRLLTKSLSEKERQEYLTIILEESTRLSRLAENTLYMSKLESMERVPDNKIFVLDEQIRQCVILLEKYWQRKDIEIIIELPEMSYSGNEEMIKQIWVNLLSNAIKFTGMGGKIIITASVSGKGIIVSISDTGIGMNEETVKRIYDKYYQADASRTMDGNGLGMSIIGKIVTLIGGEISIQSALGQGSTFTVVLPK